MLSRTNLRETMAVVVSSLRYTIEVTTDLMQSTKWHKFLSTLLYTYNGPVPPWPPRRANPRQLTYTLGCTRGPRRTIYSTVRGQPTVIARFSWGVSIMNLISMGIRGVPLRAPQGYLCVTRMNASVCICVWFFHAMVHTYHPRYHPRYHSRYPSGDAPALLFFFRLPLALS